MANWVKKSVIDFYENVLGEQQTGDAYEEMKNKLEEGPRQALNAIENFKERENVSLKLNLHDNEQLPIFFGQDNNISFKNTRQLKNKDVLDGGCAPLGGDLTVHTGLFEDKFGEHSNFNFEMGKIRVIMTFKIFVQESPSPEIKKTAIRCQIELSAEKKFERIIFYGFQKPPKVTYTISEGDNESSKKQKVDGGIEYYELVSFVPYSKSITVANDTAKTSKLENLKIETTKLLPEEQKWLEKVNKTNVLGFNLLFVYMMIGVLNPQKNNVGAWDAILALHTVGIDFFSLIKTFMQTTTANFIYAPNAVSVLWSSRQKCLKSLLDLDILESKNFWLKNLLKSADSMKKSNESVEKIETFLKNENLFLRKLWSSGTLQRFCDYFVFKHKTFPGFALFAPLPVKTMLKKSILKNESPNKMGVELNDPAPNGPASQTRDISQVISTLSENMFPNYDSWLQDASTDAIPNNFIKTFENVNNGIQFHNYTIPFFPEQNTEFLLQPYLSEIFPKMGHVDNLYTFFNYPAFFAMTSQYDIEDAFQVSQLQLIFELAIKAQEKLQTKLIDLIQNKDTDSLVKLPSLSDKYKDRIKKLLSEKLGLEVLLWGKKVLDKKQVEFRKINTLTENYIKYAFRIKEIENKAPSGQIDPKSEEDANRQMFAAFYICQTTNLSNDEIDTAFPTLTADQRKKLKTANMSDNDFNAKLETLGKDEKEKLIEERNSFPPIDAQDLQQARNQLEQIDKVNKESSSLQLTEVVANAVVDIITESQRPKLQTVPGGNRTLAQAVQNENKAAVEEYRKKESAATSFKSKNLMQKISMFTAGVGYGLLNTATGGAIDTVAKSVGVDAMKVIEAAGSIGAQNEENRKKEVGRNNALYDAIQQKLTADNVALQQTEEKKNEIERNFEAAQDQWSKNIYSILRNEENEKVSQKKFIKQQLIPDKNGNTKSESEGQTFYKMSCFSFLLKSVDQFEVALLNLEKQEELQKLLKISIDYYTNLMGEAEIQNKIDTYKSKISSRTTYDGAAAIPISTFKALLQRTLADPTLQMQRFEFISELLENKSEFRTINGWEESQHINPVEVNAFISQILQSFDRQTGYPQVALSSELSPTQITILIFAVIAETESKITPIFHQIDYLNKQIQKFNAELHESPLLNWSSSAKLSLLTLLTGLSFSDLLPFVGDVPKYLSLLLTHLLWNARSPVLSPSFDSDRFKSKFNENMKIILNGLFGNPDEILQRCIMNIEYNLHTKPKNFYDIVSYYEKHYNWKSEKDISLSPDLKQVILAAQIYQFGYRMVKFGSKGQSFLPKTITDLADFDVKYEPVFKNLLFKTVLNKPGPSEPVDSFGFLNTGLENGLQDSQKKEILNTILKYYETDLELSDHDFQKIEQPGYVGQNDFEIWLKTITENLNIGADTDYATFRQELTTKYSDLIQRQSYERNKLIAQLFIIYIESRENFYAIAEKNKNIVAKTNEFLQTQKDFVIGQEKDLKQENELYINLGFQNSTFLFIMRFIILLLKNNYLSPLLMDKPKLMENHLKFFESTWAPATEDELLKNMDLSEFFTLQEEEKLRK